MVEFRKIGNSFILSSRDLERQIEKKNAFIEMQEKEDIRLSKYLVEKRKKTRKRLAKKRKGMKKRLKTSQKLAKAFLS